MSPPNTTLDRAGDDEATLSSSEAGSCANVVNEASDIEKAGGSEKPEVDVEHLEVDDDPRKWSRSKKWATFLFICWTSMGGAMSANIYFPAIDDLKADIGASQQVINLSVSLFILFQGVIPILWSAICELYGRKLVYIVSLAIFLVGQIVCGVANNQIVFLIFRIVGAAGSSAALSVGGGSLADIYDSHERGQKLGLYYIFPLLGPCVGTLLGGALTTTKPGWRAAFYFMIAYAASCLVWSFFSKDTFRKERSLAWRAAYKRAEIAAKAKDEQRRAAGYQPPPSTGKRKPWSRSGTRTPTSVEPEAGAVALELGEIRPVPLPQITGGRALSKVTTETGEEIPVKIHLSDINPLGATGTVLRSPSNFLAILSSGLFFGATYSLTYTGALSFAAPPYNYNSLKVGLVLLCFGVGNIIGSIGGGKYSDVVLARLKAKHGGKSIPEWRLRATLVAMPLIPATLLAYAWTVEEKVPVYWPCIVLFLTGLSYIWMYSSVLAYIVDNNLGMASSAVSCNSLFRGIIAFVSSEVAEPLLNSIGNGWLYTIWTIILICALFCLLVTCWKGNEWKERAAAKRAQKEADDTLNNHETEQ